MGRLGLIGRGDEVELRLSGLRAHETNRGDDRLNIVLLEQQRQRLDVAVVSKHNLCATWGGCGRSLDGLVRRVPSVYAWGYGCGTYLATKQNHLVLLAEL